MTSQNSNLSASNSQLRICVLGTRGFPNVPGGIETHCQHLYPELIKNGCSIFLFTRKPYVPLDTKTYRGVKLVPISCPKRKYLEAIIHTFKGIIAARKLKPDILHIHAIGPSLLVPIARVLGMKVVITHHGPEYRRAKWGNLAKFVLKIGEWAGVTCSNAVITIAENIAKDLKKKYNKNIIAVIPNGVIIPLSITTDITLNKYGLKKKKYILSVGRFVPEKGFHDLIEAFNRMQPEMGSVQGNGYREQTKTSYSQHLTLQSQLKTSDLKLVIVGDADHQDNYSLALKEKIQNSSNIILTGFLTGKPLQELYSNAGLFVIPSYYEGLPIVLLEAMSYGLPCIASDIPANRNVALSEENYFEPGNIMGIVESLNRFFMRPFTEKERKVQLQKIVEKYNWKDIAKKTLAVYKKVVD